MFLLNFINNPGLEILLNQCIKKDSAQASKRLLAVVRQKCLKLSGVVVENKYTTTELFYTVYIVQLINKNNSI